MQLAEITAALQQNYQDLLAWLEQQEESLFAVGPENKWTTGQHVRHLIMSTQMLQKGLMLPKIGLRSMFGKPNRPGREYDALVARYREKLAQGGTAPKSYEPDPVTVSEKAELLDQLKAEGEAMVNSMNKWKEKDLDQYLLPHPLLGKLTIREMFMFTAYHTRHHLATLEASYGKA
ncbi:MAG: DinB family protein [Bacteroidota bacterium]